jgi:phage FluMu gp28-like protein
MILIRRNIMSRKTYTSPEVKNRWNAKHYDSITFHAAKGSREFINTLADEQGLSKAAYIRHLIIQDAHARGFANAEVIIGSGRGLIGISK